nr:hypothetical protein Hi04_10k_c5342_00028 [uncultured bacterium]
MPRNVSKYMDPARSPASNAAVGRRKNAADVALSIATLSEPYWVPSILWK